MKSLFKKADRRISSMRTFSIYDGCLHLLATGSDGTSVLVFWKHSGRGIGFNNRLGAAL